MRLASFNIKYLAGGLIVAVLAVFLIVRGVSSASMPYLKVADVAVSQAKYQGQIIRIDGAVKPGTIVWDTAKAELRFSMIDKANPAGASIAVVYHDMKPDPFTDDTQVIADGPLQGETLQATQLITRCPSKYEAAQTTADTGTGK